MLKRTFEFIVFNHWVSGFFWGVVFGYKVFPMILELIAK